MCRTRRPVVRFVFADPQKLRQREIRQRGITRELDEVRSADRLRQFARLLLRALIAPDQRGTNHFAAGIQQNRAVHLAGKAHARNLAGALARDGQRFLHCEPARAPPVARILFRPSQFRRSERLVLFRARSDYATPLIHQQRACPSRAHIDAQKHVRILLEYSGAALLPGRGIPHSLSCGTGASYFR